MVLQMTSVLTSIQICSSDGCPLYVANDSGAIVGTALQMKGKPSCAVFSSKVLDAQAGHETACRCLFGRMTFKFTLKTSGEDEKTNSLIPPAIRKARLFKNLLDSTIATLSLVLEPQFLNSNDVVNQDVLKEAIGIVVSGKLVDENGVAHYADSDEYIGLRQMLAPNPSASTGVMTAAETSRVLWMKHVALRKHLLELPAQEIIQFQKNVDAITGLIIEPGSSGRLGHHTVSSLLADADEASYTGTLHVYFPDEAILTLQGGFVESAEYNNMDDTEVILLLAEVDYGTYSFKAEEAPAESTEIGVENLESLELMSRPEEVELGLGDLEGLVIETSPPENAPSAPPTPEPVSATEPINAFDLLSSIPEASSVDDLLNISTSAPTQETSNTGSDDLSLFDDLTKL